MGPDSDWPENKNYDKDPEFHLSSGKPTGNKKYKLVVETEFEHREKAGTWKIVVFITKMLLILYFLVRKEDIKVAFL